MCSLLYILHIIVTLGDCHVYDSVILKINKIKSTKEAALIIKKKKTIQVVNKILTQKLEAEISNITTEVAKQIEVKNLNSNIESVIIQEIRYLNRKLANSNKTVVEILFMNKQFEKTREVSNS